MNKSDEAVMSITNTKSIEKRKKKKRKITLPVTYLFNSINCNNNLLVNCEYINNKF